MREKITTQTRRLGRGTVLTACLAALACANASAGSADPDLGAGFRAMYALDFETAGKVFNDHVRTRPSDPVGYAAQAVALVFGEMNRLKVLEAEFETDNKKFFVKPVGAPDPRVKQRILELTDRAQQMAEATLRREPMSEPALFALALANGILGDYTVLVEHRYWASVKFGRRGEEFARKLLQQDPEFYDAYVWTGVTNYVYGSLAAPIRWAARLVGLDGDKATGMAHLRLAAEKGRYLRPYAKMLLAIAYLRERNRPAAAALVAELSSEFPTNTVFATQAKRLGPTGK